MSFIDLHTHTTASDGTLTPIELIERAIASDISVISITDHDTFDAIPEAKYYGNKHGIEVINGLELSVEYEDGSMHMLVYGFDEQDVTFTRILQNLKHSRNDRNKQIIAKLNKLGMKITIGDVEEVVTKGGVMGRSHIAETMIKKGVVESFNEAFDKYLRVGKPAYADRYRLRLPEAVELAHSIGGVTVWAHPGLHDPEKLELLLNRLPLWTSYGLDGLESHYGAHSEKFAERLKSIALEHGMIYTGGSDFHGANRPKAKLGQGPKGKRLGLELLEPLRERIKSLKRN